MTVKELLDQLAACDPKAEVEIQINRKQSYGFICERIPQIERVDKNINRVIIVA